MRHLSIVFIFLSFFSYGQSSLRFQETVHRFGEIIENEEVSHTFTFLNEGMDSVGITSVKASCDCVVTSYNLEKIAPSASDSITISFNASNRSGAFHKLIHVVSGENTSTALQITGYVINSVKDAISIFPAHYGNLFLPYKLFNMGSIWHHERVEKEFKIYNNLDSAMSFLIDSSRIPDFIQFRIIPNTLPPKSIGTLLLNYDPVRRADLGFLRDGLDIRTTDVEMPLKRISVVATIEEYFEIRLASREDSVNYPQLELSDENIDFGKSSADQPKFHTLSLYNRGVDVLNIRTIKSNCECIDWDLKKENIPGGDSTVLMIKLDPINRKGRQFKNITLFTNDPSNSTRVISLKALIP
ncbi:MAG: hypothetical protein CBB92_06275 [Flammeovirgaceae bacterium TMED32]|nr:MAG: hypothetical protein CBB92_06275 [Flammeovirgaceae bacterium TMED32]